MPKYSLLTAACLVSIATLALAADGGKPVYGTWGLDMATMDPQVKPGEDFFRYVVGTWLKNEPIPADRTYTGVDLTIDNELKPRLRGIVDTAANAHAAPGTVQQKIGDFYASFMDEAAIAAKGLAPIKADLDAINTVQTRAQLATLMGKDLRDGIDTPIGGFVDIDAKNPKRYLFRFYQSGLSFADRDYYLKDTAEFKKLREQFRAHVEHLLSLGGAQDAEVEARWILALETQVARCHWPIEKAREEELSYNLWKRGQLDALGSHEELNRILKPSGLDRATEFLVSQPDTLTQVAKLVHTVPLAQWRAYLRYHTLVAYAQYLPKAFDDERFAFYGTVVRGQPQQQERWRRGMDLLSDFMGEPLGQLYVEQYFPPGAKSDVLAMVDRFKTSLGALIDHAAWMSASTRQEAQAKLAAFGSKVGYPDQWKDYSKLIIARDDLIGNVRRARQWVLRWRIDY